MSNRDALRRLSRKFPTPPEVRRIMQSLSEGSDLSVAITATAILEASLERLISAKFVWPNSNLKAQIFLNRGPLSDFHSKILISEAFGIVTPNMAHELQVLKVIRNAFAHSRVPLTFSHELISEEVKSLKMFSSIVEAEEGGPKLELSNKSWFLLVTKVLLIMFEEIEEHPGNADAALRYAMDQGLPKASPDRF